MSIPEIIIVIIITLVVSGLTNIASGAIYDAYWNAADTVHNAYDCNGLPSGWIALCEDEKEKYESGKVSLQLVLTIAPILASIVFVIRRL